MGTAAFGRHNAIFDKRSFPTLLLQPPKLRIFSAGLSNDTPERWAGPSRAGGGERVPTHDLPTGCGFMYQQVAVTRLENSDGGVCKAAFQQMSL